MKLYLTFTSKEPICLPVHYNHMVQAALLNWLSEEEYQRFIHDKGYHYEKRSYKLFTFSKLQGQYELSKDKKYMRFKGDIRLIVSSSQEQFIEKLAKGISNRQKPCQLGNNILELKKMHVKEEILVGRSIKVKTLSPIVAYSTVIEGDKKRTKYYGPQEDAFSAILKQNIIKKYKAIYGEEASCKEEFSVTAVDLEYVKKSTVYYKHFIINGYNGHFILQGNPVLIQLALEAGLGGKNAQGFGAIEILD